MVGPVPVAPLSRATVNGIVALQLTEICAVALSAEVKSEALPKFMFVAETPHWCTTVPETENVPLSFCELFPPMRAAHVDAEVVLE